MLSTKIALPRRICVLLPLSTTVGMTTPLAQRVVFEDVVMKQRLDGVQADVEFVQAHSRRVGAAAVTAGSRAWSHHRSIM